MPFINANVKHVFHQYTLKVKNRNELKKYLLDGNIESAIYYPVPCHAQNPYSDKENIISEFNSSLMYLDKFQ